VKGIILVGDCCDPYAPESVRASTGSIFGVTLVRMNLAGVLDLAKAWPGDVVGTTGTARSDFRREYLHPVLLAMGSESRGLSAELLKSCTQLVKIPMKDGVESLNVATATGLMLYQVSDSIK
jgi:TrmH family RNA methyltransferase